MHTNVCVWAQRVNNTQTLYFECCKWGLASSRFKQTNRNEFSPSSFSLRFILCLDSFPQLPLVLSGKYCTMSFYSIVSAVEVVSLRPQIHQGIQLVWEHFSLPPSQFCISTWVIHSVSITLGIFKRSNNLIFWITEVSEEASMALEHILHYKDSTICKHPIGKRSFYDLKRTSTSTVVVCHLLNYC